MRKLIAMFTVTALLSGCGIFNKVFKHQTSEKMLEHNSKFERSETITTVTDNSKITITERLDTNIKSPEVRGSAKSKIDIAAIAQGLNIIDDQFISLYQSYNPIDSTLKTEYIVKPRLIPVPKERKTEILKDVKSNRSKQQENKSEDKKEIKNTEAIVDRKTDYKLVIIVFSIIILSFFLYKLIANYIKRGV